MTGAAGFIGSNFVHYVRTHRPDWDIVALDLLTYAGNLENIADRLDDKELSFVRGDICDRAFLKEVFSEPIHFVFHFAAESHVDRSIHSAEEFIRTNVLGTEALLSASRDCGIARFIHVSTDEVYGSLGATGVFHETLPLDPTSPYSSSKAASDLIALSFEKTYGLDVCVTRCTNNYGPYQFPEKFIPLFISNALEDRKLPVYGDGMQVRSWLHVDDHCEALLRVAEHGRKGEIYNIGGGTDGELPNITVAKLILAALQKPDSLLHYVADRPAHDRRYAVDIAKLQGETGWSPCVSFEDGLAATINWYVSNRTWWERIKAGQYRDYYDNHYGSQLAVG